MSRLARSIFFFVATAVPVGAHARADVVDNDCTKLWIASDAANYKEVPFPETNVRYYRYPFMLAAGQRLAFRIRGHFPDPKNLRYFSYVVYDQDTTGVIDHIPDFAITGDDGSKSPFPNPLGGTPGAPSSPYTISVASPAADLVRVAADNSLNLPFSATDAVYPEIWLRYYVSKTDQEVPTIQAFDAQTLAPVACPAQVISPTAEARLNRSNTDIAKSMRGRLPQVESDGGVHFFLAQSFGLFANPDNDYIAARSSFFLTDRAKEKRVFFFSFTPPARTDVRYWSMCLGGADWETVACLNDESATLKGGKAVIVIGPPSIQDQVQAMGYNFWPWSDFKVHVLIYRNMLARPSFSGDFSKIAQLPPDAGEDKNFDPTGFFGEDFIGGYSPIGMECMVDDFLSDGCGAALP